MPCLLKYLHSEFLSHLRVVFPNLEQELVLVLKVLE
nr:MAG TPA: hypothetical protein [Crassvirales sp.]